MLKMFGAVVIIVASIGMGRLLGNSLKRRIDNISAMTDFIDYISSQVTLFKAPLDEIYSSFSSDNMQITYFVSALKNNDNSIYDSASSCGLLYGEEEKEIIRSFSDKIRTGAAEDLIKLCSFTVERLKKLEERLCNDLPDKRRIYSTVSILAGASTVILLI